MTMRPVATVLVFVALLAAVILASSAPLAAAHTCKAKAVREAWGHDGGFFFLEAGKGKIWKEVSQNNVIVSSFREVKREPDQIFLFNDSRNVGIVLKDDLCGISENGDPQYNILYKGRFMPVADCTKE
ncbi:hypothetical protein STCU_10898 [Strigomonas culicis]|uniref:Uncharacterized protein n=1 Tax=Strigomonas culicis TaxID=28005 RepID=S9TJA0_9TRYP|nr:hypothetical protein STCU_10898 [Strigomonas culicis]|eukprot:EPY16944.1 hypothetical protein STCU_10898 [Strigomonas culicis]